MFVHRFTFAIIILLVLLLAGCGETAVSSPTTTPIPTNQPPPATALPTSTPQPTATKPPPTATAELNADTAVSDQPPDFRYLEAAIDDALKDFDGFRSVYVVDLQSGESLDMNGDLAIAGMSLLKIPILVETYRTIDGAPSINQRELISETMGIQSGNFTANLLLHTIAGQPNTFAGADILTASMKNLGLFNTFIAVPYDAELPEGRLPTYLTPANQRTDMTTFPDPYRQTTIKDIGRLLQMVYECATRNSGSLRETYPDEITQAECREILDVMQRLKLGAFIENGVPQGTAVAHKHGWIDDTHGDAAVVFTPGGDYVLGIALYDSEWLEWEISNPLIAEVSRRVYAHFNDPVVYAGVTLPTPTTAPAVSGSATPDWPRAVVTNTQGIGLTVRAAPGGAELAIVPDGTILALLPDEPQDVNGYRWHKILLPDGRQGWAAADFFTPLNATP